MSLSVYMKGDYENIQRFGLVKNKANWQPLAGNSKQDEWVRNDRPHSTINRAHLKKQSQFEMSRNVCKYLFKKGLRKIYCFQAARKQSQSKPIWDNNK